MTTVCVAFDQVPRGERAPFVVRGPYGVYMQPSGTGNAREKHPSTGEVEILSHRMLGLGMPAHKHNEPQRGVTTSHRLVLRCEKSWKLSPFYSGAGLEGSAVPDFITTYEISLLNFSFLGVPARGYLKKLGIGHTSPRRPKSWWELV